jgi:hypothetical protein
MRKIGHNGIKIHSALRLQMRIVSAKLTSPTHPKFSKAQKGNFAGTLNA